MSHVITLRLGDSFEVLRELPEGSVGAVVCDPPYGLEFMWKAWDKLDNEASSLQGIVDPVEWNQGESNPYSRSRIRMGGAAYGTAAGQAGRAMQEWHRGWLRACYRVLQPGGIIKAFSATRTFHRLAAAMEDAGFLLPPEHSLEAWGYGSGFPKYLNTSKAIDKFMAGVPHGGPDPTSPNHGKYKTQATEGKRSDSDQGQGFGAGPGSFMREAGILDHHEATTPEAAQFEGWATALKPGWEPFIVGIKP